MHKGCYCTVIQNWNMLKISAFKTRKVNKSELDLDENESH